METFVSQLAYSFWSCCSEQVSSSAITFSPRPSLFVALCLCLASVLTLLRWVLGSAWGRGHVHVAAVGLGKECSFWHREPSCSFSPHPSSPGWSWAILHYDSGKLLFLLSLLGITHTFHQLQKCKNPAAFWLELLVVLKGKIIQGSNLQEDFGVSLLLIPVTANPNVGLNTQMHQ